MPRKCSQNADHVVVDLKEGVRLVVRHEQLLIGKSAVQHDEKKTEETMGNSKAQGTKNVRSALATVSAKIRKSVAEKGLSLEEAFKFFDTAGEGVITKQELDSGLKEMDISVSVALLETLWPLFDRNGDGTITKLEFTEFMENKTIAGDHTMVRRVSIMQRKALRVNDEYNRQRQDRIKSKTIQTGIERITQGKLSSTAAQVRQRLPSKNGADGRAAAMDLFHKYDADGSGLLDKAEFKFILTDHTDGDGTELSDESFGQMWAIIDEQKRGVVGMEAWLRFVFGGADPGVKRKLQPLLLQGAGSASSVVSGSAPSVQFSLPAAGVEPNSPIDVKQRKKPARLGRLDQAKGAMRAMMSRGSDQEGKAQSGLRASQSAQVLPPPQSGPQRPQPFQSGSGGGGGRGRLKQPVTRSFTTARDTSDRTQSGPLQTIKSEKVGGTPPSSLRNVRAVSERTQSGPLQVLRKPVRM
jgi:Ca2+-binding EF-hand superfamily protein